MNEDFNKMMNELRRIPDIKAHILKTKTKLSRKIGQHRIKLNLTHNQLSVQTHLIGCDVPEDIIKNVELENIDIHLSYYYRLVYCLENIRYYKS